MDESLINDCMNAFSQWLVGTRLREVVCRGELYSFVFDNFALHTFTYWRFSCSDAIHFRERSLEPTVDVKGICDRVKDAQVSQATIEGPWRDARIIFSNGCSLETFQDSLEYENWNLTERTFEKRRQLVAGCGSTLTIWD